MAERAEREIRGYELTILDRIAGGDATITDKKKHEEALSRARQMRAQQEAETATVGRTFVRDAEGTNAFSKLSRYETAME